MENVTDPVCGMGVKDRNIASEHDGTKFYFCSSNCKTSFDASPEKYLQSHETHHGHKHHCC
ncbi:MAG: YHS domain-containing protein [Candidatus Thermoplasmatota archaeon]|nr:YHS domain-containing protein [Candidatus Thermoplasmatota archaeon]MDA8142985.1 YHS domain-containing protein [Thermoplasmatales archaeon]